MEWHHQHFSLGIFEPYGWTQAMDWSLLASLLRRNTGIVKLLDLSSTNLKSVVHPSLQSNGQLIVRDPDFLIPFCILSSLLNGTEPSGNITNSQLHGVLRALPISIVLKLFENLESPYSDILRQRVFASALDAGDAKIVDAMLSLGLDPCEKIWFDSDISNSANFPLERALYHRQLSVCKAIVTHRCMPRSPSDYNSVQDQVLRELIDAHYRLTDTYDPMTSSEWAEFVDLIVIPLSRGAHPIHECFFVAFYDQSLAPALIKLDNEGVNGWIKRGLLSSRWPEAQRRSPATKATEFQQVHWMLTCILRENKEHIATGDSAILSESVRALGRAVEQRDLQAIFIIVEACSEMSMELGWSSPDDPLADILKPCLEQNWELAQNLIRSKLYGSQTHHLLDPDKHTTDRWDTLKENSMACYDDIANAFVLGDDVGYAQIFEQYRNDTGLREYLCDPKNTWQRDFFKVALRDDQLDIVVDLFKRLSARSDWELSYILHLARTDAISAILCDSESWSRALPLTLANPPDYTALENLIYCVEEDHGSRTALFGLNKSSNANQQITLRCLCYYAIHKSHYSLLKWLVENDLDMGEFIQVCRENQQVSLENIRRISAPSGGLMPNRGVNFLGTHIYPSMISIAAMQNNVSMIHLFTDLGADGRDSMALQRAVETGADFPTIDALIEVADLGNRKRGFRHYGSAALRETIRRKNYPLLQKLASKVDINGIELFPNEMPDPRSAEPLSPLGEAILAQDNQAVEILLDNGCNRQALVCYDGLPKELKRGAYLQRLSPLLAAIDLDDLSIVRTLVENKASVDPGPTQGLFRSPLQRAAEVGSFEIVEYLLTKNVPVDDPPFHSGGTPLQLAALSGHVEVAELLIRNGANINHPPARGNGRTAFEAAAEWGRADVMSMLIKRGADLDKRFGDDSESQYHRAIRFAESNGHPASKRFVEKLYEDTGTSFPFGNDLVLDYS
jgi:ankyrin repeat protein